MATGSQRKTYKEVAVRQELGHLSGELSTEKLGQLALGPVLSVVLGPSWSPQNSSL